jgi:hypothetical protein
MTRVERKLWESIPPDVWIPEAELIEILRQARCEDGPIVGDAAELAIGWLRDLGYITWRSIPHPDAERIQQQIRLSTGWISCAGTFPPGTAHLALPQVPPARIEYRRLELVEVPIEREDADAARWARQQQDAPRADPPRSPEPPLPLQLGDRIFMSEQGGGFATFNTQHRR